MKDPQCAYAVYHNKSHVCSFGENDLHIYENGDGFEGKALGFGNNYEGGKVGEWKGMLELVGGTEYDDCFYVSEVEVYKVIEEDQ